MRSPPVVLVIEDNSELRLVLKEALGAEGYHVVTTRDGAEAVDILRSKRVDLLISDLTDPRGAGQALDSVLQEFPDLPVVALSAAVGRHPAFLFTEWENSPRYRTLSKPFRLGELLAVSREVLGPTGGTSPSPHP